MKFKVGDKVKVVRDDTGNYPNLIGRVGVIADIYGENQCYPYVVTGDGKRFACAESELELVTDAPTTTSGIFTLMPSNPPLLQALDSAPLISVKGFSWNSWEIGYLALTEALQGDNPYVRPHVDDEAMSVWIDLMRFCKESHA